jgi:AraC-like DNA-binding protein
VPVIPSAQPAFRHLVHSLSDPDEFGVALSGGNLVADFLDRASRPTRVEQFQSPEWALDFHEAHVKARVHCPLPLDWASFGFMRGRRASSWEGFAGDAGVIVCNPPGHPIDGRIEPGFTCTAVNIPVDVWERARKVAGVEPSALDGVAVYRLPEVLHARFEQRLRAAHGLLQSAARQPHFAHLAARDAANFASELATTVWELSVTTPPPRDSLRNRARLARRAEAWMREHFAEPVQVPDLCLALRISRRELEYAFRTVFDQSPRDYLQALRLNAVRRALRRSNADTSVLQVALDCGITHPGRFAAHYRALFGERPSDTLSGSQL